MKSTASEPGLTSLILYTVRELYVIFENVLRKGLMLCDRFALSTDRGLGRVEK